ncbi:MAG: GEVED domain-containing protein [Cyanobacteria bacterium J06600_6]
MQITYAVGDDSSYSTAGSQALFLTSGMSAGCNISGSVFEDSNGNDLLNPSEPLLDNIAVSAYLDDGDGVYETDGSDRLIETQDTATGAYEFTKLAENEDYWIVVDESDSDLNGYEYDGGNVDLTQINPRLISLTTGNVTDVNFPFAIANPNQTTNVTSSCQALGGTLSGNNLFTPLDNGTFGFENGQPDQSPTVDPYPGVVSGGQFDHFYSVGHGEYGYVANDQITRNPFQHENITDPVYGFTGRFFGSDPDTDTPTLTTTLNGLTPNQFYEYSFWAANSEPNPPSSNDVSAIVNGTEIYNTGDLPTFSQTLEWKKHTVSFTNGNSSSITIDLESNKTGPGGNDFYLDNIELRSCNFIVDYGDAPITYGEAIQTTIPSSPNIYLGTVAPDGENTTPLGGDNGVGADGDDSTSSGMDDEDAFTTLSNVPTTGTYDLNNIPVNNTSGANVTLHGWIDFDRDGKFSASEYQSATVTNGETTADLNWTVPNGTNVGDSYARFRITPDVLLADDPNTADVDERSLNAAVNGEVEDYQIAIADAVTLACPTARADLWFANDESGSVSNSEFDDSLDFIYQVSDQFTYGSTSGIKAGIIGWAAATPNQSNNHVIIPITETFGDPGDTGLIDDNNISTDTDGNGVREEYTAKKVPSNDSGTRLDRVTNYLANIITTANGARPNTPQVAIILTDANSGQITSPSQGGDFRWESAAFNLKDPVDGPGASIVLIIIDEAAAAYNAGGAAKTVIDNVVGTNGKLLIVPTYQQAADATEEYISLAAQAVCDSTTPVASDPELLLAKRITAINPGQTNEVSFNDFVDDANDGDNNANWVGAMEGNNSMYTNTYTVGEINGGNVIPSDVLEYTIYFLSDGGQTANNVLVCDLIPANTELVLNDFSTQPAATGSSSAGDRGLLWEYNGTVQSLTNANDGDAGYYFPPGDEPSDVFSNIECSNTNQTNDNGAVVFNLGNLPELLPPECQAILMALFVSASRLNDISFFDCF